MDNGSESLTIDLVKSYSAGFVSSMTSTSTLNRRLYFYLYVVFLPLGFAGNFLSFVLMVLSKQMRATSYSIYLAQLAVFDTISLSYYLLGWLNVLGYYLSLDEAIVTFESSIRCKLVEIFHDMGVEGGHFTVVIIAIERVFVVGFPFRAKRLCTRKHSKVVCGCCTTYVIGESIWRGTVPKYRPDFGCYFNAEDVPLDYFHGLTMYMLLPVAIVFICNAIIAKITFLSSNAFDAASDHKRAQTMKVTLTLFVISMTFLLFSVPLCVPLIILGAGLGDKQQLYALSDTTTIILGLNYGVNFYLYILTGKQIRAALSQLFCG
ncbi:uncharacterized protein LOC141912884 [Tubulanus polymorphus]|uniref:uncharacterized protein LOC141912884 n=1 Tax=Tubulanus polymorphus TaxID=672921 RepID=UPI003DA4D8D5